MKLRMSKKTQNLSYIKFQKWTVRKLINRMDFWAKTWNLRMSGGKGIRFGAKLQLLHHKFLLAMQVVILGSRSWVGMSLLIKLYTQTQWVWALEWIRSVLFQSCHQYTEVSSHDHQQRSHSQTPKSYSSKGHLGVHLFFFLFLFLGLKIYSFELIFQIHFQLNNSSFKNPYLDPS